MFISSSKLYYVYLYDCCYLSLSLSLSPKKSPISTAIICYNGMHAEIHCVKLPGELPFCSGKFHPVKKGSRLGRTHKHAGSWYD